MYIIGLKNILMSWVTFFNKDSIEEEGGVIRCHKEEIDKIIQNTVKEGSVSNQFPIELDDMVIYLNHFPMYLPEYIHLIFKSKKYPFTSECVTKKCIDKQTPFSIDELMPYIYIHRNCFDNKGMMLLKKYKSTQ